MGRECNKKSEACNMKVEAYIKYTKKKKTAGGAMGAVGGGKWMVRSAI